MPTKRNRTSNGGNGTAGTGRLEKWLSSAALTVALAGFSFFWNLDNRVQNLESMPKTIENMRADIVRIDSNAYTEAQALRDSATVGKALEGATAKLEKAIDREVSSGRRRASRTIGMAHDWSRTNDERTDRLAERIAHLEADVEHCTKGAP